MVLEYVNKHVSKQSKIGEVEAMKDNFEKTATQKIRRFKYKEKQSDDASPQEPEDASENKDSTQE